MTRAALYFGFGSGGHFLRDHRGTCEHRLPTEYPGFPWEPHFLDGGVLGNRKVPDQPDGRVQFVCGGRDVTWFGFVWWDRSGDRRGASNSGFYVRGYPRPTRETLFEIAGLAFAYACRSWPDVVARQIHPLVLVDQPEAA